MTALGIALTVAGGFLIFLAVGQWFDNRRSLELERRGLAAEAESDREWFAQKERDLTLRAESLEERYAERERMWAEERTKLLDRIQFPLARGMELMPPGDLPEGQSDQEVDEKWIADERSRVEWDPDLQGFGSDEELVVPEQVAD